MNITTAATVPDSILSVAHVVTAFERAIAASTSLLTLGSDCFPKACSCNKIHTLEAWMAIEDRKPWLLDIKDESVFVVMEQAGCACKSHMVLDLGEASYEH